MVVIPGVGRSGGAAARWAAAILACVLFAGTARATTFEEKDVRCPVCTVEFRVLVPKSTNTYGGVEADGTTTPNGDPVRAFFVWTCPRCHYSRESDRFDRGTAGEAKEELLAPKPEARPFPEDASQRGIPTWRKYDLAIRLLEKEGASPRAVAWAAARAALALREESHTLVHPEDHDEVFPEGWADARGRVGTLRDGVDRSLPGARTRVGSEIRAARDSLREAEEAKETGPALHWRRLVLGAILRSHGENVLALPHLKAVRESAEAPKEARAIAERLEEDVARERGFQGKFVRLLGKAPPVKKGQPEFDEAWLASEFRRRLGEDAEAEAELSSMLAAAEAPDWVLLLLRDAAEYAGEATPRWRKTVVAAWDARVRSLVSKLSGEDEGAAAAERLAALAEPAVRTGLAILLASKEEAPSQNAAQALAGYDDPGPEAIATMRRRLLDPEDDLLVRWHSAVALAALADPSCREAFRMALAEGSNSLRGPSLEGLALVGEAEDVPALLAAAKEEKEGALDALGLLAGRELRSVEAAAEWWKANGGAKREAWTLAAIRRGDASLAPPLDRAKVPALIRLLEDEDRTVRWSALRTLRGITGRCFGVRHVLHDGKAANMLAPDAPLDMEKVLSEGWTVSFRGVFAFDVDDFEPLAKPLRERDARSRWERAAGLWDRWWNEQGGR